MKHKYRIIWCHPHCQTDWCQKCSFEDDRAQKSLSFSVLDCKRGQQKKNGIVFVGAEQESKSLHEEFEFQYLLLQVQMI